MDEAVNKTLSLLEKSVEINANHPGQGAQRAVAIIAALNNKAGLLDRLSKFSLRWKVMDVGGEEELLPNIDMEFKEVS